MARYTGPSYKKARRVGFSITETGKELARRPYGPGQHGNARKGKLSDYGTQLKEKQKVRFMYGVNERQFRNTFDKASKLKGVTGTNFLRMLESRLDNLVYRIGFATTRRGARQLVNHGHVTVNGKKVDIPSYSVKAGDVITIKSKSAAFLKSVIEMIDMACAPAWMTIDKEALKITFDRIPEREELDPEIKEQLVIEYYSK